MKEHNTFLNTETDFPVKPQLDQFLVAKTSVGLQLLWKTMSQFLRRLQTVVYHWTWQEACPLLVSMSRRWVACSG